MSSFNSFLCVVLLSCALSFIQSAPTIVTGPIIGKVTTTTARVLLEFDTQFSVTVILTDPSGKQIKTQKTTKASIPVPFSFSNLDPNTKYKVSLDDPSISITESYFTTLSGESGKLKFAVVSCNIDTMEASTKQEDDLWADILAKVQKNEIQYLLQIGDQVYTDLGATPSTYVQATNILNSTPKAQWDSTKQRILELLRDEYRTMWGLSNVRKSLAKIPNLMIFDDHDIRNDWGYYPQDTDINSVDYFFAELARQVYYEYQRQLREDINFNDLSTITTEYYFELLNDIGFFFIDHRGIRTWHLQHSQMGSTKLGQTQTSLLEQILDPTGNTYPNMNSFFLINPQPFMTPWDIPYNTPLRANTESWGAFANDRTDLFNTLRTWKLAKTGREVAIISGDSHIGGTTNIMYNGEVAFLELISSSIASGITEDDLFKRMGIDVAGPVYSLGNSWTFQQRNYTNLHNYQVFAAQNEGSQAKVNILQMRADPREPEPSGSARNEFSWKGLMIGVILTVLIVELI